MDKTIKIGVYGFVLKDNNKFLLIQRADHDTQPGIWEMPGGGLEFGEDVEESVLREVKEETNLLVKLKRCLGAKGYFNAEQYKHTIRIAYLCSLENPQQEVSLSVDHTDYKWASIHEILKGNNTPTSQYLEYILNIAQREKIL